VPTAVETPDVAHDELRLVVQRRQVRLRQQVLRRADGVDHLIQARPAVHQRECLLTERFEHLSGVRQRRADALTADDGEAVAGEEHLGAAFCHGAQGERPVAGIALHLLRVAGVRQHPDEEVAGAENATDRRPQPGVIVGLSAAVVQLEPLAAERENVGGLIGFVRLAVRDRPLHRQAERLTASAAAGELAAVDCGVVAGGTRVAVEAGRHRLVRDHVRQRPALLTRLGIERQDAEDVVNMAV
jgi:hypothetical protein